MTQRHNRLGRRRRLLVASAAVLALAGAVVGTVGVARWSERLWEGDPYPVADPAATAQRLDGHTQAVYDVLGLPHAQLDPDWPGGGSEADGYGCYYRGLKHWSEQLSDSPPSPPHVVDVSNEWALKGVSRDQAVSALRRVRKALTRQGWKVTAYENSRAWLRLALTLPDTDDTVSIQTYPRDRLQVSAYADCARYPSGTPVDDLDEPELPAQGAPAQLRG
ncbi:hypothetical protein ACGFY7_06820 [Streptomyces prunicolor]|uniref:hypothetical protein n=1 Tax=Streptomyces prunicolor TaxID=67348 RepID=UPI00371A7C0C